MANVYVNTAVAANALPNRRRPNFTTVYNIFTNKLTNKLTRRQQNENLQQQNAVE